jgi:hypothetical protein
MKSIIKIYTIVVVLFLGLWGCKAPSPKHTKSTIEKDSIYTTVNYIQRDTTITVPGDTLRLQVPIYSLSEVPITVQTSRGTLELSKLNEEILAKCNIDDLQKIIALQDKLISEYKSNTKTEIEYREVEVKVYPTWLVSAAIFGLLSLFFFLFRFFKSIGI